MGERLGCNPESSPPQGAPRRALSLCVLALRRSRTPEGSGSSRVGVS